MISIYQYINNMNNIYKFINECRLDHYFSLYLFALSFFTYMNFYYKKYHFSNSNGKMILGLSY